MTQIIKTIGMVLLMTMFFSCSKHNPQRDHGLYMLIDTSGTYSKELKEAQKIIEFVIKKVEPGDSFAVQRIDSGSFSEKDIVYSQTFDTRPIQAGQQRSDFRKKIDEFVNNVKPSAYTDISGGLLQGIQFLNETGAGRKTILIFSDMKEELPKGYKRNTPLQLNGFRVIALNVTKLKSDNFNPDEYFARLKEWKKKVEAGGGEWIVINDLKRLDPIFQ
ncbi:MAG: hypothetical protein PVG20_09090 [Thioalkalispiraceae bacterium]|jgi:hypothetical protein